MSIIEIMQAAKLRDCGRTLSDEFLLKWKRRSCAELPEDYAEFLQVFNGGKFCPRFLGPGYFPKEAGISAGPWRDEIRIDEFYAFINKQSAQTFS